MKESNIEYAQFLAQQKSGLQYLKYYVTDTDNRLLKGFKIELNSGKYLNVPLSARIAVRKTLINELDNLISKVKQEIEELD